MRLNVKKYQEFMREQNIDKADIERMIGITVQTMDWIFENEYLEISTLERLAKVANCDTREIALPDHSNVENVIEWVKDGKTATLSLTQGRTISKVMKLAKNRPGECKIIAENKDGSRKKKWRAGLTETILTLLLQGMKWADFQFLSIQ